MEELPVYSRYQTQLVHYSLRELLLKIIIKGSFTENFYPLKAFSSGNKALQNSFFS